MTWPREGSREIADGVIVSEAMDWCNSPTEPVPYRIWAKQIQATNLANSVRQTDDRSHVKDSIVLASYGDEPGVGGGVVSGTQGAECTPKTWSESVRAEGRNMVRHDDEWWMNHKNTYGRLIYVGDHGQYGTPDAQDVDALLGDPGDRAQADKDSAPGDAAAVAQAKSAPSGGVMNDAGYQGPSLKSGTHLAYEAPPVEAPTVPPEIETAPAEPARGAPVDGGAPRPGTSSFVRENQSLPAAGLLVPGPSGSYITDYPGPLSHVEYLGGDRFQLADGSIVLQKQLDAIYTEYKQRRFRLKRAIGLRVSSNNRKRLNDCCINYHQVNKTECPRCTHKKTASHHGMIDFPFRTGERENPGYTAPGAPSLDEALTICVPSSEENNEHSALHTAANAKIRGSAGPDGLTTFGKVKDISYKSIDNLDDDTLSLECKTLYKELLSSQFDSLSDNLPLRADPYSPLPSAKNDAGKGLAKAWNFEWK